MYGLVAATIMVMGIARCLAGDTPADRATWVLVTSSVHNPYTIIIMPSR